MKAAVLHAYDESLSGAEFVRYEDVPDPRIEKPTDVIVRIGGAGVCRNRPTHRRRHLAQQGRRPTALHHGSRERRAGSRKSARPWKASRPATLSSAIRWSPAAIAWRAGAATTCTRRTAGSLASTPTAATRNTWATGERSLIKLPASLSPKAVAPYTDAGSDGLPSRERKALAPHLLPGEYARLHRRRRSGPISVSRCCAHCAPPKSSWWIVSDYRASASPRECGGAITQ